MKAPLGSLGEPPRQAGQELSIVAILNHQHN